MDTDELSLLSGGWMPFSRSTATGIGMSASANTKIPSSLDMSSRGQWLFLENS